MKPSPEKLNRGVWVLPYLGPNGETVMVAIRADGRILGQPVLVPWAADGIQAALDLWDVLDAADEGRDARAHLTLC